MTLKSINLTPDPRILEMLGQINLKGWQCIAELIDNSIDSVISRGIHSEHNIIEVQIPTRARILNDEPVIIRDYAAGMDERQLENALKAGYSSQQSAQTLGLFGMGFNIATARLGSVATVWTSKRDMDYDIGVKIDLKEMKKSRSFERELLTRKNSPTALKNKSGTSIEISGYYGRASKLLNRPQIKKRLNHSYSRELIDKYGIEIIIDGDTLQYEEFCLWDKSRTVVYLGTHEIPPIITFKEVFETKKFCTSCLVEVEFSNGIEEVVCQSCGSNKNLIDKEYGVRGWVGIQRYFDREDFGINIIRNGRIIKHRDKSLFTWRDPNGIHEDIFEYPIDNVALGGRIVGEMAADFIIPTYTKDSYTETEMWQRAVGTVRGLMPLQPDIATKRLKMRKNWSPLARLCYGFKKTTPGRKYLVPGTSDGNSCNQLCKDMADSFHDGDPDYQTDQLWYELVERVEKGIDPEEGSNGIPGPDDSVDKTTTDRSEEEDEFKGLKEPLGEIKYDLQSIINQPPIKIKLTNFYPLEIVFTPIIFKPKEANVFDVYINQMHKLLRDFADGWQDLLLMEVASLFHEMASDREEWTITRIYYELKAKYAADSILNVSTLVDSAASLMQDIQNYLILKEYTLKPKPKLWSVEETLLKENHLKLEGKSLKKYSLLTQTSSFIKYMNRRYLFKFIQDYPSLIFDDQFFSLPYEVLDDEQKNDQLQTYMGYFNDLRWLLYQLQEMPAELVSKEKPSMIRCSYSVQYLNKHRV